jgi:hypothetical protein
MSKGLFIARAFQNSGHLVIGADFEPHSIPVCGRFSTSLKKFYSLPLVASGSSLYIQKLIKIIKEERVDLWISCSGVMSAVEDGEAAQAVERFTKCKAVQFGTSLTRTLHEKHSFIENTKSLGLNVPETKLVTSLEDAMEVLSSASNDKRYILKSVGVDDAVRGDLTLLPFSSNAATLKHLSKFNFGPSRPFVLQQFIQGPEYCTHAIIIRGRVAAFTACKSAELLMHYQPLSPEDPIFQAMLDYTQLYVERMEQEMTGHFSMDFLIDEGDREMKVQERMFPIECNPRAHTAVVNFGKQTKGMVDAYLSVLSPSHSGVFLSSSTTKHYWIGHDMATCLFLPFIGFCTGRRSLAYLLTSWSEIWEHVILWRDPTYEMWDPFPAWWLYSVYWPCNFLVALFQARWWSRCNVSTCKIFGC